MTKCIDCGKEMDNGKTNSCNKPKIRVNGKIYKRDTIHFDVNERCHDCGIENKNGNIHHFGCDMERCPACGGQLISCNCEDKRVLPSLYRIELCSFTREKNSEPELGLLLSEGELGILDRNGDIVEEAWNFHSRSSFSLNLNGLLVKEK